MWLLSCQTGTAGTLPLKAVTCHIEPLNSSRMIEQYHAVVLHSEQIMPLTSQRSYRPLTRSLLLAQHLQNVCFRLVQCRGLKESRASPGCTCTPHLHPLTPLWSWELVMLTESVLQQQTRHAFSQTCKRYCQDDSGLTCASRHRMCRSWTSEAFCITQMDVTGGNAWPVIMEVLIPLNFHTLLSGRANCR